MGHHAVDAVLLEGVVCGKAAEAGLVHGMVLAIWEMLLQKVKERLCGGLLRVPLSVTRLGQHTDLPSFCVDINSYVNLLSLEGNFVSLHIGTVLIVCHLSFALQIYNPIIIVPTFSLQTMKNTTEACHAAGGAKPPKSDV